MASARWYSSPLSALPHGLDLSLSLWLQDEGRTLIASAKAQAKSNLQVRGDMSSSIYAITVTGSLLSSCLAAVQFRVKLLSSSLLTWSLKSDIPDSLFQSIPHSLQNVQRVNSKEKYSFLKDLPVTSVSIGISSIMHLSSSSPRSKNMAAANTKKHWREKTTTRKLIFTLN